MIGITVSLKSVHYYTGLILLVRGVGRRVQRWFYSLYCSRSCDTSAWHINVSVLTRRFMIYCLIQFPQLQVSPEWLIVTYSHTSTLKYRILRQCISPSIGMEREKTETAPHIISMYWSNWSSESTFWRSLRHRFNESRQRLISVLEECVDIALVHCGTAFLSRDTQCLIMSIFVMFLIVSWPECLLIVTACNTIQSNIPNKTPQQNLATFVEIGVFKAVLSTFNE